MIKIKKYVTILTFTLLATSAMTHCSTNNTSEQQNGNVTITTTTTSALKLTKEYVCSTLSALFSLGSVFFGGRTFLGFITAFLSQDKLFTNKMRIEEVKADFLIGLPISIILWKTGDFLSKLAKT